MNSLLKGVPLFPGLCPATKPAAQSLFSNICMFDRYWASFDVTWREPFRDSLGAPQGRQGKGEKVQLKSAHFVSC